MNDFDFCKARLDEIDAMMDPPDKLVAKVQDFMRKRMPAEPAHRQKLQAWAQADLGVLEASIGGGKVLPLGVLSGTNRRMAMLQTVIGEIEAFDTSSSAGNVA
jgi:hypothetical protein